MWFILDQNNKIESSSASLNEGINILGEIYGFVKPGTFELLPADNNSKISPDFFPAKVYGNATFVKIGSGRNFIWASPDISGCRDFFYAKLPNQKWILSDNFFEVLSKVPSVTMSRENVLFFIRHGYFLPAKTFFEEITRIKVGNRLRFINNNPIEDSLWNKCEKGGERDYETFKKSFLSVFKCIKVGDNDAILLSGGCDSGLIAALSVFEFSKKPLTITEQYIQNQTLKINERDAIMAERVANFLKLEHKTIEFDFNKETVSALNNFFERMPLAAHYWLGLFKISGEIAGRQIKKIWCGQNADSIYNMGPTEKTLGGPIKRFYLTKEYIRSLDDISDKSNLRLFYRTLGELGRLAFMAKRKLNIRQPKTFKELLLAYEYSEEYLSMPFNGVSYKDNNLDFQKIGSNEAKKLFFERKVQSFLIGRDPRVIYVAPESYNIKAFLPYSATNMMHFFRGLELNFKDILKPKKFIYRYLQELCGKDYKKIYSWKEENYQSKSFLTWEKWQEEIIKNTKFGQELTSKIQDIDIPNKFLEPTREPINLNDIQHVIGLFWLQNILAETKKLGINIKFVR